MTQAQNSRIVPSGSAPKSGKLAPAILVSLVALTISLLGASPALAGHEKQIYCDGHGGAYGAAHYHDHDAGYVVPVSGTYRFYPSSAYATLALDYHGTPSIYVSGGYFYPLQIGYGPIYEPAGYFEIQAGRYGRTHLGLQIGIGALPTIGFGYLSYRPHVVHYRVPRWHYRGDYVRRHAAPHVHYRANHDNHWRRHVVKHRHSAKRFKHTARHDRKHYKRHDRKQYKWEKERRKLQRFD